MILTAREALPPPEIPLPVLDPVVFGTWPMTPMKDSGLPGRHCYVHRTEWSGGGDCWVCAGGTA